MVPQLCLLVGEIQQGYALRQLVFYAMVALQHVLGYDLDILLWHDGITRSRGRHSGSEDGHWPWKS